MVKQSRIQRRINLHIPNVYATTCKQKTRMVSKKDSAWEVEGLVEVVGFIVTVCQNLTCFLFSLLTGKTCFEYIYDWISKEP